MIIGARGLGFSCSFLSCTSLLPKEVSCLCYTYIQLEFVVLATAEDGYNAVSVYY